MVISMVENLLFMQNRSRGERPRWWMVNCSVHAQNIPYLSIVTTTQYNDAWGTKGRRSVSVKDKARISAIYQTLRPSASKLPALM